MSYSASDFADDMIDFAVEHKLIGEDEGADQDGMEEIGPAIIERLTRALRPADERLREAADRLLNAIYEEYPEGLPFYCRDAAQTLLDTVDEEAKIERNAVSLVRLAVSTWDSQTDKSDIVLADWLADYVKLCRQVLAKS